LAKSGAAPFSLTFNQSATGGTTSVVNYGTLAYTAGATRVIVANCWIPSGAGHTITGITVGGVALAQVSGAYIEDSINGDASDIWESTAPLAGSSGAVIVTYSASLGFTSSVAVYSLTTTTPTAAAATNGTTGVSPNSLTINVPSGGGGLVVSAMNNGAAITITNTANDTIIAGSNNANYGHTTATGASVSVSASWSSGTTNVMSIVSWSP